MHTDKSTDIAVVSTDWKCCSLPHRKKAKSYFMGLLLADGNGISGTMQIHMGLFCKS